MFNFVQNSFLKGKILHFLNFKLVSKQFLFLELVRWDQITPRAVGVIIFVRNNHFDDA